MKMEEVPLFDERILCAFIVNSTLFVDNLYASVQLHINIIIYNIIPEKPFNLQQNTIMAAAITPRKKTDSESFDGFICTIFSFIYKWIQSFGSPSHHVCVYVFVCESAFVVVNEYVNCIWKPYVRRADASNIWMGAIGWFLLLFSCNHRCSAFPSIAAVSSHSRRVLDKESQTQSQCEKKPLHNDRAAQIEVTYNSSNPNSWREWGKSENRRKNSKEKKQRNICSSKNVKSQNGIKYANG